MVHTNRLPLRHKCNLSCKQDATYPGPNECACSRDREPANFPGGANRRVYPMGSDREMPLANANPNRQFKQLTLQKQEMTKSMQSRSRLRLFHAALV
jgi:hypothetical protein